MSPSSETTPEAKHPRATSASHAGDGVSEAYDFARGLKLGFFRHLTKPIKVPEFMDTLNDAFEAAEGHALPNTDLPLPS
jgi:hypothetical protein